ncbi:hypothetical protein EA795_04700 [Stutzerimonas nitrititolerans]|uniref:Uncharacterized protein n=1 Tax=Stutzerimonas nitrititolerans TaxID=2482751 RepID=A0ABX9V8F6_9GAMM|nr:hypothetical protein EA795_04700 [Stutzerimonas nitrititolerans]
MPFGITDQEGRLEGELRHGSVLRLLGRNCPEPTRHGAAQAVRGRSRRQPQTRNAGEALDGEHAVIR